MAGTAEDADENAAEEDAEASRKPRPTTTKLPTTTTEPQG